MGLTVTIIVLFGASLLHGPAGGWQLMQDDPSAWRLVAFEIRLPRAVPRDDPVMHAQQELVAAGHGEIRRPAIDRNRPEGMAGIVQQHGIFRQFPRQGADVQMLAGQGIHLTDIDQAFVGYAKSISIRRSAQLHSQRAVVRRSVASS